MRNKELLVVNVGNVKDVQMPIILTNILSVRKSDYTFFFKRCNRHVGVWLVSEKVCPKESFAKLVCKGNFYMSGPHFD